MLTGNAGVDEVERVDPSADVADLKCRVAKVHRILAAGGMLPLTKGHAAARVMGADLILVPGHIHAFGRTIDTTTEADIFTMDMYGKPVDASMDLVGERYMYSEVMRARPEVGAMVHCHPPYATSLGIAGVNVLPLGNRGGIFAPRVPILDFDGQIDRPERGAMINEALGDSCAVVLKNHGIVAIADTPERACIVAFALEETARMQCIASTVGVPQPISDEETARVKSGADHVEYFDHVWQHYAAMDPQR